jgi:hypothetical protein
MNHSQTRSSSKIFLSSQGQNKVVNSNTLNTDITFYFDPILLSNSEVAHFVLGLEQASIPISIYMINNSNNVMVVNGITYTIPVGNYNTSSMETFLNSVDTGIQFLYIPVSNQYQVTIDPTADVVISGTASSILGFVDGTYANPHTFTNVVNLTSTTGIIVQIENVTTTNRDNSGKTGATLARIPITCAPLRILQYFNAFPFYSQIANRELTYFRIRLLNDDYTPLVLVGNPPWFMVIRIDYSDKVIGEEKPNEIKNMRTQQARQEIEANIAELNRRMEPKK